MSKRFLRFLSFLLILVLTIQISGVLEVAALMPKTDESVVPPAMPETANISISETTAIPTEEPEIIGEDISKRTESSKHFRLSDGSWMAVSYSGAVHYQAEDGSWLEIDNTIEVSGTGKNATYSNTAGAWDVSFPHQLSDGRTVTVTKDTHELSFSMVGEIRSLDDRDLTTTPIGQDDASASVFVQEVGDSAVQIQDVDLTELIEDSEYPELVQRELCSRLEYTNVYTNTDVVFDLMPNLLKESIVIHQYSESLQGYLYTINTDGLTPVLADDGSILLNDRVSGEPVLQMPAPYLVDDAGEYCYDVSVELQGVDGRYVLAYHLPHEWMADSGRQWPVILDPVVKAVASQASGEDQTVYERTSSKHTSSVVNCGYEPNCGAMRFYLRYNELPELSSADVIVNARLQLYIPYKEGKVPCIEIHKVTGDWSASTIKWSTQPSWEETVEDYAVCQYVNSYYYWDITDIVKGWYTGDNTGMVFKVSDEAEKAKVNSWVRFHSVDFYGTCKPTMMITYRNNNGLESYWDYTSAGVGRAGTVSVNDYTGNLVISRTDMAYSGNRMPANISFTYNANDRSCNIGYGNGWRANYSQTVTLVTISEVDYYCWIDGDGTRIYFYNDNGAWKDENGLDYTLTVATSSYTIQDRDGNQLVFDSNGRLTQVIDGKISSNKIQITYDSAGTTPKISTVTDGAGRKYTFTYGTNGNLSSVSYFGTGTTPLETVTYAYSGNNLTTVTYADNNTATYAYTGGYLTSATGCQGERVTVSYDSIFGKVEQIATLDGTQEVSSAIFLYGDNYTKVTDHNERWCIYQFNNQGNTVSVYNHRGQALYGAYSDGTPNQLETSSRLQDTVTNLLSTRSYSNSWSQSVTVTPGKAYTLSGTGTGTLTLTAGNTTQTSSGTNGGRSEVTITIPAGVSTLTASGSTGFTELQLEQSEAASRYNMLLDTDMASTSSWVGAGTVSGDGRSTAETGSRANLDSNSLAITGSPTTTKRYSQTISVSGAAGDSYSFGGWLKADSVALIDPKNPDNPNPNRRFGIEVRLLNGTAEVKKWYIPANDACAEWQFISSSILAESTYNTIEFSFIFDYNANIAYFDGAQLFKETFAYIYDYDDNGRIETVTDLEGNVTTYAYRGDSSDITSITLPGNKTYSYTYNTQNLLTGTTSATGIQTTHTYDSYGNNTQTAITYSGADRVIQSNQTYTSDGNFVATVTGGDRNTITYNYNTQKSTLTSVTDPLGNTTANTYDTLRRLQSVTSGDATASYTYNKDRLSTIYHSGGTNGTTYSFAYTTAGLTDTVSVGSYELVDNTYNSGTWTLASQEYGNSDAWHYTYNEFDDLVSAYTTGGTSGTEIRYFYNSEGALARIEQYSTTLSGTSITARTLVSTERYYYDTTDRMVRITRADTNGTYEATWVYDHNDNVTQLVETINGTATTTSYTYDADNRVSSITSGGLTTTYNYDGYGRIGSKATAITEAVTATTAYTYRNPGAGLASTQVETVAVNLGDYRDNYTYSYDANGNITSIVLDGKTTSYVYDSLNQLVRENNESAGKTWVWTYDNGGNILSKTEYAYTTGELGEAVNTDTYTYGDSAWGDLLTAYNGVAITHDQIGNPLNDGTWSYTWDGRQLASMTDGTTTWSYKYNADGLRTEKTNGTITYKYVYSGSTLVQMSGGSNVLRFFYDGTTPIALTINGAKYYYITNLQGDVIAIVGQSGSLVASYTYDAWGNPISAIDHIPLGLADLNPLRYRGYVYDRETSFYYLQSRYYDPKVGRFINADAYVSTGQGVLGHNMFAYCLNNPVNHSDKSGRTADDWAGWIGEQLGELIYELFTGDDHPSHQTRELENRVRQKQNEHVGNGFKSTWDAYMRGNDMQQESMRQESQMIIDQFSTKETSEKTLAAIGSELLLIDACISGSPLGFAGSLILFIVALSQACD